MQSFKLDSHSNISLLDTTVSDPLLTSLGRELLRLDSGLGLFRLVHLVDAISRNSNSQPRHIVSIGSGEGLHEAFIARLFPSAMVLGVDLKEPPTKVKLPNLSFLQGDLLDPNFTSKIPPADFVFSIECLEHIHEDYKVTKSMTKLLGPGGSLYIQVPFASESELADPILTKHELENYEHVRPGYTSDQLMDICKSNGLDVSHIGGTFWFPMQPLVWAASERFGIEALLPHWVEFLELAQRDLRDEIPVSRNQATGIKVLGNRPPNL